MKLSFRVDYDEINCIYIEDNISELIHTQCIKCRIDLANTLSTLIHVAIKKLNFQCYDTFIYYLTNY